MREDLDPRAAERLVAEQVGLGRQEGHVTVPEGGQGGDAGDDHLSRLPPRSVRRRSCLPTVWQASGREP